MNYDTSRLQLYLSHPFQKFNQTGQLQYLHTAGKKKYFEPFPQITKFTAGQKVFDKETKDWPVKLMLVPSIKTGNG